MNLEENIVDETRFGRIRKFNLYYLAFVSFVVGYGRIFSLDWMSFGKHPEKILPIVILSTLYLAIREKGYEWPITYREKVFASFAIFVSMMPFLGLYWDQSIEALYEFWTAAVFALLLMYNVRDERALRLLFFSFLLGAAIRGGGSIFEYVSGSENVRGSFTMGRNVYANFLLIPISFAFGHMIYGSKKSWEYIVAFLIFVFLGAVLLTTQSRTPFVAIVAGMVLCTILLLFGRKILVTISVLILTLVLLIYVAPNSRMSTRIKSVKWADVSLQYRVQGIWPAAIAMYKDHNPVLGSGAGAFGHLIIEPKYKSMIREERNPHAHNSLLQALVSYGIIGVSVYIFFIFQLAWLSWYVLKWSQSPFLKSIGCAGFIWTVSSTIAAMTDHMYNTSRYNMSVAFIVCCVLMSYYTLLKSQPLEHSPRIVQ